MQLSIANFFSDLRITSNSFLFSEFSSQIFLTGPTMRQCTLAIKIGNVVLRTVSRIDSGKYVVVSSMLVKISLKSKSNRFMTSSYCARDRSITASPLIISVTFNAALKHFFSRVMIMSTDSLNSCKNRKSLSNTFPINCFTCRGF